MSTTHTSPQDLAPDLSSSGTNNLLREMVKHVLRLESTMSRYALASDAPCWEVIDAADHLEAIMNLLGSAILRISRDPMVGREADPIRAESM